jgi:hypothetical protein
LPPLPESAADFKDLGIEVKVKGATVKRDLFGMETWGKAVARVKGEICADFLPIYRSMIIHPSLNEVTGWPLGNLRSVNIQAGSRVRKRGKHT